MFAKPLRDVLGGGDNRTIREFERPERIAFARGQLAEDTVALLPAPVYDLLRGVGQFLVELAELVEGMIVREIGIVRLERGQQVEGAVKKAVGVRAECDKIGVAVQAIVEGPDAIVLDRPNEPQGHPSPILQAERLVELQGIPFKVPADLLDGLLEDAEPINRRSGVVRLQTFHVLKFNTKGNVRTCRWNP